MAFWPALTAVPTAGVVNVVAACQSLQRRAACRTQAIGAQGFPGKEKKELLLSSVLREWCLSAETPAPRCSSPSPCWHLTALKAKQLPLAPAKQQVPLPLSSFRGTRAGLRPGRAHSEATRTTGSAHPLCSRCSASTEPALCPTPPSRCTGTAPAPPPGLPPVPHPPACRAGPARSRCGAPRAPRRSR